MSRVVVPVGYHAIFGGQSSESQSSIQSLLFALVFGIAVAYMILAAQFDSFIHPVTVLTVLRCPSPVRSSARNGQGHDRSAFTA